MVFAVSPAHPVGMTKGVLIREAEVTQTEVKLVSAPGDAAAATTAAAQAALGDMMGDAPLCDTCGHITVRNGSCYKCLNCGNSLGCS